MRLSKTWFRYALEQLSSVSSKHITDILLFYWLNKRERPSDEFWNDLDEILSKEIFESLLSAAISCRYEDSDHQWRKIDDFDYSRLPILLPKIYKRGILRW